jgi:hypothetical protein
MHSFAGTRCVYFFRGSLIRDQDPFYFFRGSAISYPGPFIFQADPEMDYGLPELDPHRIHGRLFRKRYPT